MIACFNGIPNHNAPSSDYWQGFQAGAASRDADIAELVTALEHILAGSLSLPRFAEAEAIAVIAKVRKP